MYFIRETTEEKLFVANLYWHNNKYREYYQCLCVELGRIPDVIGNCFRIQVTCVSRAIRVSCMLHLHKLLVFDHEKSGASSLGLI